MLFPRHFNIHVIRDSGKDKYRIVSPKEKLISDSTDYYSYFYFARARGHGINNACRGRAQRGNICSPCLFFARRRNAEIALGDSFAHRRRLELRFARSDSLVERTGAFNTRASLDGEGDVNSRGVDVGDRIIRIAH